METQTLLIWAMIATLAAATFAMRLSFLALWAHTGLPSWLMRALGYVPAAAIAALIAPLIFPAAASGLPSLDAPRLIAATAAFVIAYVTRSTLLTIVLGMATLWGAQAFLGAI